MKTTPLPKPSASPWRAVAPATLLPALIAAALVFAPAAQAQEKVLNVYSARHYQTDEQLYGDFSRQTGVKINRIELGDEPLLERMKSEGDKSPADVVLLVDATRLYRAQKDGLFQPVQSKVLTERIPAEFRAGDNSWFGFSNRARIIVYNKEIAVQFLEYLASDQAQAYFANGNNEWPTVSTADTGNDVLASLGKFKADKMPTDKMAARSADAQKLLDKVGYK